MPVGDLDSLLVNDILLLPEAKTGGEFTYRGDVTDVIDGVRMSILSVFALRNTINEISTQKKNYLINNCRHGKEGERAKKEAP